MATIRERQPGVWEVRAFTGRDERGRPTQVSRTVKGTKRAAQRVAASFDSRPAFPAQPGDATCSTCGLRFYVTEAGAVGRYPDVPVCLNGAAVPHFGAGRFGRPIQRQPLSPSTRKVGERDFEMRALNWSDCSVEARRVWVPAQNRRSGGKPMAETDQPATNKPKGDRVGNDYREGTNANPGGQIDTGDSPRAAI